jgi:hypothetical protein
MAELCSATTRSSAQLMRKSLRFTNRGSSSTGLFFSHRRRPTRRYRIAPLVQCPGQRHQYPQKAKPRTACSMWWCRMRPKPAVGQQVELQIDWPRRYALMRLHTALHVMSCVVLAPVAGGNISPDKARLDFDVGVALLNADHIQAATNALIAQCVATETVWITD